uniref:Glia maturation factor, beta (inferred by orthology to a zebrafish protein) n=1 Tax=Anisakis simplex TaxID=6269 RepID=A0A0M3JWI5_ANISI
LQQFRFSKSRNTNALILKIDRNDQKLLIDERLEDCTIEEICDELPSQQPRYILISYKLTHSDGRESFPLCLIFYTPSDCCPDVQMLYAGSRNNLVRECQLTRSIEIREVEELTQELLDSKMN